MIKKQTKSIRIKRKMGEWFVAQLLLEDFIKNKASCWQKSWCNKNNGKHGTTSCNGFPGRQFNRQLAITALIPGHREMSLLFPELSRSSHSVHKHSHVRLVTGCILLSFLVTNNTKSERAKRERQRVKYSVKTYPVNTHTLT